MAGTTQYQPGQGTDRGCPNGSPHHFHATFPKVPLYQRTNLLRIKKEYCVAIFSSGSDRPSIVSSGHTHPPTAVARFRLESLDRVPIKDSTDISHMRHLSWLNRLGWLFHFGHRPSVCWTQAATATEDVAEVWRGAFTMVEHPVEKKPGDEQYRHNLEQLCPYLKLLGIRYLKFE